MDGYGRVLTHRLVASKSADLYTPALQGLHRRAALLVRVASGIGQRAQA